MAKTTKAAKPAKNVTEVLNELASDRRASGCTLSNPELAFIVKVVRQCAG